MHNFTCEDVEIIDHSDIKLLYNIDDRNYKI